MLSFFSLLLFNLSHTKKKSLPQRGDGRRLPPSPPSLPFIGHLHLLGSLPHRNLRSLAESYGPVVHLRLGPVPAVVVSTAAAAEEALKTRDVSFSGRPRLLMVDRLFYGCNMALGPYGKYWREARRISVLHLLARAAPPPSAVSGRRSNAIVSRATFGNGNYRLDGDVGGEKLRHVLADLLELLAVPPVQEIAPWLWWVDRLTGRERRTRRTFEALDGLLERVIADHRRRRSGGRSVGDDDDHRDFVDVLLDVEETDKAGFKLETDNIKALILDMFAAGTDSTYMVLEWAMAELINHPDVMQRLQEDIRGVVGVTGQISEDHLHKLPYLKSVVAESLRLHSPASFLPRATTEDTELLGYHIPKGTRVLINSWAIGRDPVIWERAEEFVPERFVEAPVDYRKVGQDFRFLPFGAGRRGCPAAAFGAFSVEMALTNMLYHFDWELPESSRKLGASFLDMSEAYGLSVRRKAPLLLVAKPWVGA
ncbi:hypothetical protein EJB05_21171, partial [Eragrostis curvula]